MTNMTTTMTGTMSPSSEPAEAPDDIAFICSECAKRAGGVWPKGHAATIHEGECGKCGKRAYLANVGDWDWPDGRARGMRD